MITRKKQTSFVGILIIASMIVILLMSCFFTVFLLSNFRVDHRLDVDDVEGLQYVNTRRLSSPSKGEKKVENLSLSESTRVEQQEGIVEEEQVLHIKEEEHSKIINDGDEKRGNVNEAFERKGTVKVDDERPLRSGVQAVTEEEKEQPPPQQPQQQPQQQQKEKKTKTTEEVQDIPRDGDNGTATLTLFSLPDCQGDKLVFYQSNQEKLCRSCIDFCGKHFDNAQQTEALEGKSILLEAGEDQKARKSSSRSRSSRTSSSVSSYDNMSVVVSMHHHCAGTWKYPNLGFHTFIFEGCQNIVSPTHAIFHVIPQDTGSREIITTPKMSRFPKAGVFGYLKYYERFPLGPEAFTFEPDKNLPRYVTFNIDCGGWNNIRMGFEHAVLMAWATNRTLVMPPPAPFYLIDFGPFAFEKPGTGFSHFGDYFNLDLLQQLPAGWISTNEFYNREKSRFGFPERFAKYAYEDATWPRDGDKDWLGWLGEMFGAVPAGPDHNVVMEPDPATYLASDNSNPRAYGTKKQITLDPTVPVLHFPACQKPHEDFRYLGQISTAVLFADVEREKAFHRFWRAAVVYSEDIFKVAAAVIAEMGLFNFTSLHVRRNELQYADSFQDSASTLRNIDRLLYPNELIYLATDETKDPHFFDALRAKHPIVTWNDFYDEKAGKLKFNGMPVRRKVINCIEQLICAGGRRFFGTVHSTFSSYIFRLRGYVGAPDTEQRHHNVRYTGLESIDSLSKEPMDGYTYMKEDPRMWEVL